VEVFPGGEMREMRTAGEVEVRGTDVRKEMQRIAKVIVKGRLMIQWIVVEF
jgi:hypothetical protein